MRSSTEERGLWRKKGIQEGAHSPHLKTQKRPLCGNRKKLAPILTHFSRYVHCRETFSKEKKREKRNTWHKSPCESSQRKRPERKDGGDGGPGTARLKTRWRITNLLEENGMTLLSKVAWECMCVQTQIKTAETRSSNFLLPRIWLMKETERADYMRGERGERRKRKPRYEGRSDTQKV